MEHDRDKDSKLVNPAGDSSEDRRDYTKLLPLELAIDILSLLPSAADLCNSVLSCSKFYGAFVASGGAVLESVRENENTRGFLPTALMHSLRLLEPDIAIEHLHAYADAFATRKWDTFVQVSGPSVLVPHPPSQSSGYFNPTSTAWYNCSDNGLPPRMVFSGDDDESQENDPPQKRPPFNRYYCASKISKRDWKPRWNPAKISTRK